MPSTAFSLPVARHSAIIREVGMRRREWRGQEEVQTSCDRVLLVGEWPRKSYRANDEENVDDDGGVFDVLFVADPSQSWCQKDDAGHFGGFNQYESRIRAASRPYSRISLVGDSMGGSAALLFSHLATDAIVAFSPQVDLEGADASSHVVRSDMTPDVRRKFRDTIP